MKKLVRNRRLCGRVNSQPTEILEPRRLLCSLPHAPRAADAVLPEYDPAIHAPGGIDPNGPEADTGGIIWSNRGTTDNFAATYGTLANAARNVVDAAFFFWNRTITNLNQDGGNSQIDITVTANGRGTGLGGSGGVNTRLGTKPRTGSVNLGGGSDTNGNGTVADGEGFYIDANPYDFVEYQGTIRNAFNGDATTGAVNALADLFSLTVIELQHAIGVDTWNQLAWFQDPSDFIRPAGTSHALAANDGVDSPGKLYVFNGGGIQALLTSNNGGGGGSDFGYAVHSARPGNSYTTGGTTYVGQDDTGVPIYIIGRRYMPSNTAARMLGLIYGYSVTPPHEVNGSFYAVPDPGARTINVRNPGAVSGDVMEVRHSGVNLETYIDIGADVGGTNMGGFFVSRFNRLAYDNVVIDGSLGNDFLRTDSLDFADVTLRGGQGNDFLDVSFVQRNLDLVNGDVTIEGNGDVDSIFIYDDNDSSADTHSFSAGAFDSSGTFGTLGYSGVENITFFSGTGVDVVNVTSNSTPLVIQNRGGNDVVNIGNGVNGVQSITADVQIQNDPAFSDININNAADAGNRNWLVNDPAAGFGAIGGLAPALIVWDNTDVNAINLTCGTGVDNGVIARLSETLNINNAGGSVVDTIRLGDATTAGMSLITQGRAGGVTIDNNPFFTDLVFEGTSDTLARTVTFDLVSGYNQMTGMSSAVIRYDDGDTRNVTLRTGGLADTVNVLRHTVSAGGRLDITTTGGLDTANLGVAGAGVQGISSGVHISNPPSFTLVNVSDAGNAAATNSTIDASGGVASITGLAPGVISWAQNDVNVVNMTNGGQLDVINLRRMTEAFTLSNTGSADILKIGFAADGAQGIANTITVTNPPSFTTIQIDDTGNPDARTITEDTTLIGGSTYGVITGLASGAVFYKYADTSSVQVVTGGGDDVYNVRRTGHPYAIQSSGGNDTVNIGNATNGVQSINGRVDVQNNFAGFATTINIDDAADTVVRDQMQINDSGFRNILSSMAPTTIEWGRSGIAQVNITTGNGVGIFSDTLRVQSGTAPVNVKNAGTQTDSVVVGLVGPGMQNILGSVSVGPSTGLVSLGFTDQGNLSPRDFSLDDDGVIATVSGMGPVDHSYDIGTVSQVTFNTGSAGDTFSILRNRTPLIYNNLAAGSPADRLNIGNAVNGLADITGNITPSITVSPYVVDVTDAASTTDTAYTFTPQFFGSILISQQISGWNGATYIQFGGSGTCQSVTLAAGAGNDSIFVPFNRNLGLTINDGAGNDTINIGSSNQNSELVFLQPGGGLETVILNSDSTGTAQAIVRGTMTLADLQILDNSTFEIEFGGDKTVLTQSLTLGLAAIFEINDNAFVWDYDTTSVLPSVQTIIEDGYNGGAWNGFRMRSQIAGATPGTGIGYAESASVFGSFPGTFAGVSVDDTAVVCRYTLKGDCDVDRDVDIDDFGSLASSFNQASDWRRGDFDYNFVTDIDDFGALAANFNQVLPATVARRGGLFSEESVDRVILN